MQSIVDYPEPKDIKELQSFLGLTNFYRKFIGKYFFKAKPLFDLLKKESTFHFGEEQKKAFDSLKNSIIKKTLLTLPDFDKSFILTTDASGFAIGAILEQHHDNGKKIIAFASRTLLDAERRYSTIEER